MVNICIGKLALCCNLTLTEFLTMWDIGDMPLNFNVAP